MCFVPAHTLRRRRLTTEGGGESFFYRLFAIRAKLGPPEGRKFAGIKAVDCRDVCLGFRAVVSAVCFSNRLVKHCTSCAVMIPVLFFRLGYFEVYVF